MDPAPSRGVDVGIAADGEDLLEEQEQALIRCVKTAGLRKPRELALVDQLLEVRRIRRRATAVLVQQRDGWAAQATTLQGLLTTAQETLAAQETQRDERLHEEISRMEKNYRAKLEEYVFRRDASVKTFVSGLKEKYTKQISILESKLKEISEEYDNKTRASVVEKQQRRIVELEAGLADQTDHIRRYKETILAISERERDLESALSREGARCARLANEKGSLKKQITDLETSLNENMELTQRQKRDHAAQLARVREDQSGELQAARREVAETGRAQLAEAAERHDAEMQLVDAKIRKALNGKDEIIAELTTRLRAAERKVRNAEALIEELNAGISDIS